MFGLKMGGQENEKDDKTSTWPDSCIGYGG